MDGIPAQKQRNRIEDVLNEKEAKIEEGVEHEDHKAPISNSRSSDIAGEKVVIGNENEDIADDGKNAWRFDVLDEIKNKSGDLASHAKESEKDGEEFLIAIFESVFKCVEVHIIGASSLRICIG